MDEDFNGPEESLTEDDLDLVPELVDEDNDDEPSDDEPSDEELGRMASNTRLINPDLEGESAPE